MFAPLPGVSRSGLTIAAALALGFRRTWAVQLQPDDGRPRDPRRGGLRDQGASIRPRSPPTAIAQTVAATVVAGLVGYVAIVWLVRVVRSGRLWYFSVYLVVLGLGVLLSEIGIEGSGPRSDQAWSPTCVF